MSKWNADIPWITQQINAVPGSWSAFTWEQLVWQEIMMWVALGQPVTARELTLMTIRRGFDKVQRKYLQDMLILLGLYEEN